MSHDETTTEVDRTRRALRSDRDGVDAMRVVSVSRTYATSPVDLWAACTEPDRIRRWFLPVSGELREGGRYALEGNASGTITGCDPPRTFEATWEFSGFVSWILVRVDPDPEGASFTVEHRWPDVDDPHWQRYGPGAGGVGWELGLRGLARHLATGAVLDAAAEQEWALSADGRSYIEAAAGAWGEVHVSAGAPAEAARLAAARTAAFYTGAEEPEG